MDDFMDFKEVEFAEPNFRMKALEKTLGIKNSTADILGVKDKPAPEPEAAIPADMSELAPDNSGDGEDDGMNNTNSDMTPYTPLTIEPLSPAPDENVQ